MNVVQFPSRPPATTGPDRYVSRAQLADELCMSLSTVDRMVREGCPSTTFGRRMRRFRVSDVHDWLKGRAA